MNRPLLALRHVAFEDLGLLEPLLQQRGYGPVRYLDAGSPAIEDPAVADGCDLVVVLGGPIGADDEARYPFLRSTLRLIERRLQRQQPLLGICLGAQLMARALGAKVAPMAHGLKEIGFGPLTLTPAGRDSPLAALPADTPVLHWHGDQFELPAGLDSLAATPLCPHQAFLAHPSALALQFHLEMDPRCLEQWLVGHAVELAQAGIAPGTLRHDAQRHGAALAAGLAAVVDAWLPGA